MHPGSREHTCPRCLTPTITTLDRRFRVSLCWRNNISADACGYLCHVPGLSNTASMRWLGIKLEFRLISCNQTRRNGCHSVCCCRKDEYNDVWSTKIPYLDNHLQPQPLVHYGFRRHPDHHGEFRW